MTDFVSGIYVFFASLHFLEMGQLVFHLLQEWIGIDRLNGSQLAKVEKSIPHMSLPWNS